MKIVSAVNINLARIGAALMASIVCGLFILQLSDSRADLQHLEEAKLVEQYRAKLLNEFDRAFLGVRVLSTLARDGVVLDQRFEHLARKLFSQLSGTLSLQLAPDGVVRYLYPNDRDSGVMGNNLLTNPVTRQAALRAMSSKQMVIDGPRPLQQGGLGLVAREPVYINGEFWGFATAVFRLDSLLARAGLADLERLGYHYGLWVADANNQFQPIIGNNLSLEDPDIAATTVRVGNQLWQLALAPKHDDAFAHIGMIELAIAVIVVILVTALVSATLQLFLHRNYLHELVAEQTNDLRQREVQLSQAQRVAKLGSWQMPAGSRIRSLSTQAMRLLNSDRREQGIDAYCEQIDPVHRSAFKQFVFSNSQMNRSIEYRLHVSNQWMREVVEFQPEKNESHGIIQDISEEKHNQATIWQQANIDELTGLPNTANARRQLSRLLENLAPSDCQLTVVLFDIKHFKSVNDGFGQRVGDQLLIKVAEQLSQAPTHTQLLARFAGDVFLMVLKGRYPLVELINQMQQLFQAPIQLDQAQRFVDFQLGVAYWPEHGTDYDALVRSADIALHAAKESSSQFKARLYSDELLIGFKANDELDSDLRNAISQGELFMQYQPLIDSQTGKLASVEALIRWHHPQKGLMRPDQFVARAEQNGQIFALGREIIHLVAYDSKRFASSALGVVPIAINLSRTQFFDDSFAEFLTQTLSREFALDQPVTFEVTESYELTDYESLCTIIENVRYPHLKWSLDDFGTGYSSYSAIGMLPVDNIKIDRSFIQGLERNVVNQAIVTNIIAMAHTLGKTVTAEGVETREQAQWLAHANCDLLQGYYYSRPVDGDALIHMYQGQN